MGWGDRLQMAKGIEIKDLVVGTGDEATKDSVVVVSLREFLRRGDEGRPFVAIRYEAHH